MGLLADTIKLISSGGNVSVQNPLPATNERVFEKDIWVDQSTSSGWTNEAGVESAENIAIPFNNLHTIIKNETTDNPKQLLIHFNNTIQASLVGVGCWTSGAFSNTKITGILSGNKQTVLHDDSSDATLKQSSRFDIKNSDINAILFEFYTTNTVTISNIFINKITSVFAITASSTKFADAYAAEYVLNNGSQQMNVDGSVTPVDFVYEFTGEGKAEINRFFIDLQDGTQAFIGDKFGAISGGLANGVDVIIEHNGVDSVIENWKINMDISMTCYDFVRNFKDGAYIARWTVSKDIGSPITLLKGDKVTVRINDNLTALDAFRFRMKLAI